MSALNELNFILVYYTNDGKSKMVRIPFNGLMPDPVTLINQHWIDKEQTFYTHASIEFEGQTLVKIALQ